MSSETMDEETRLLTDILKQLEDINTEIHGPIRDLYKEKFEEFYGDTDEQAEIENKLSELKERSENEFANKKPKINSKEKKFLAFGETSAGKSTLINGLLKCKHLPAAFERTTSSVTKISKSLNNRSFFYKKNFERNNVTMAVGESNSRNDLPVDDSNNSNEDSVTTESSSITDNGYDISLLGHFMTQDIKSLDENDTSLRFFYEVFIRKEDCPLLTDDVVIIDTPGIFTQDEMDNNVVELCENADFVVFVISSTSTVNNHMINFINLFCQTFSEISFYVVFNFWDIPDENEDREDTKMKLRNRIKHIFRTQLDRSINLSDERIFFLSAKEQILFNANDEKVRHAARSQERHQSFLNFERQITELMKMSSFKRRFGYLEGSFALLNSIIEEHPLNISHIEEKITTLSRRFDECLRNITNFKEKFEEAVVNIFTTVPDEFIMEVIKKLDQRILPDNETNDSNTQRKTIYGKANAYFKRLKKKMNKITITETVLSQLTKETIDNLFETLKLKIIEIIGETTEGARETIMIFEMIIFPFYKSICKIGADADVLEKFEKILKTERNVDLAKAGTSGFLLVGGAITMTVGIPLGVFAFFVEEIVAASIGCIVGGAALTASGSMVLHKDKYQLYRLFCKDAEEGIKVKWTEFKIEMINSNIQSEIESHIRNTFEPLQLQWDGIHEKMSKLEAEMDNLSNLQLSNVSENQNDL